MIGDVKSEWGVKESPIQDLAIAQRKLTEPASALMNAHAVRLRLAAHGSPSSIVLQSFILPRGTSRSGRGFAHATKSALESVGPQLYTARPERRTIPEESSR
jgi:hypothetical protein